MRLFNLFKNDNRELELFGEIDNEVATSAITKILDYYNKDKSKDIKIIINSIGGMVTSSIAIYDVIRFVSCDVVTEIRGQAHGMALLIAGCGTKGKRFISSDSIASLQPFTNKSEIYDFNNEQSDAVINTAENKVYEIFSIITGQQLEKIKDDIVYGLILTAKDVVEYGFADKLMEFKEGI